MSKSIRLTNRASLVPDEKMLAIECTCCGKLALFELTSEEIDKLTEGFHPLDVFPPYGDRNLSIREMIGMTGWCNQCWDALTAEPEEFESE